MKKTPSIPAQAKKIFTTTYARVAGVALIGALANIAMLSIIDTLLSLHYSTVDSTVDLADLPLSATLTPLIGTGILAILAMLIAIITGVSIATILINNKSFTKAIGFGITKGLKSIPVQLLFALLLLAGSIPSLLIIFLGSLMASEILSFLFILLGICLILLPIAILVRGMFVVFIWVERQKEQAWAIIKKSFALTKGTVGWMIVLSIAVIIIAVGIVNLLLLTGLATIEVPISAEDLSTITDELISIFLIIPALHALVYALYQHAKKHNKSVKKKNA